MIKRSDIVQVFYSLLVIAAIFCMAYFGAQALDTYNTRVFGAVESPDGKNFAVGIYTKFGYDILVVNKATGVGTQRTHDGMAFSPAWFPGGDRIAWSCSTNQAGVAHICVTLLADGTTVRLTHDVSFDSEPSVSPDGTKIVFTRGALGKRALFILDVQSGKIFPALAPSEKIDAHSPKWHPTDQSTILFVSKANGVPSLYVMNKTTISHLGEGENGIWSPDGKRIIFGRADPCDTRVQKCIFRSYIMNADGSGKQLFPEPSASASSWLNDGNFVYATKSIWVPGVFDRPDFW
jgi:TolB protein